jgi:hypothetical protein
MGPGDAPVLATGAGLEAVLVEAGEGGFEVGHDHGEMASLRRGRPLLVHQVDLGAVALDPGESIGQGGRRLYFFEAEQGEELDGAGDVVWLDLDAYVVEHQNANETRAAATTIAVDQITASAVISMSRP